MEDHSENSRISRIATNWSLVGRAHHPGPNEAHEAQARLLRKYQGAVQRYLTASLRDREAADELFQDFALRFVKGDFSSARPEKGRFRDYLKTVLIHMVVDHRRRRTRAAAQISPESPEIADVAQTAACEFDAAWRTELLDRAWAALEACQRAEGVPYYSALRFRADQPEASAAELGAALAAQLHKESAYSEAATRKLLQRAREKFGDLLVHEVAESIETGELPTIEQELEDLQLLSYCKSAIERRRR